VPQVIHILTSINPVTYNEIPIELYGSTTTKPLAKCNNSCGASSVNKTKVIQRTAFGRDILTDLRLFKDAGGNVTNAG